MRLALAALAAAGCASFEDPSLVIDLRVVGMTMTPAPERVIDVDLRGDQPPTVDDVLAQLQQQPAPRVCASVADPATARDLRYSMHACLLDDDERCDPARPQILLADGEILYDPEVWIGDAEPACAEVPVDGNFVGLLYDALMAAPESAIVGVDFAVQLRIGRVDEHPANDVFGTKRGRVAARIPEMRRPNQNPQIVELQVSVNDVAIFNSSHRPCAQPFGELAEVRGGDRVTLYPVEADGTRETFYSPTLDGEFVEVTEYIEYQWLAVRGSFSDETTGGPPDLLGNESLLGTDWTAPTGLGGVTDVPIWVVARDARYGVTIWETCIRVIP